MIRLRIYMQCKFLVKGKKCFLNKALYFLSEMLFFKKVTALFARMYIKCFANLIKITAEKVR